MRIEVNGEWVETSFLFWVLVVIMSIFTFWIVDEGQGFNDSSTNCYHL